ncbi:hypothetical protein KIN20_015979 [Parelaphostrongylus tenuis]|uniref:C2H2-type domain-containing protein n=1 Tax=Parelaphostrongylus tenuis TaxID=148309 RepID=A0AAD5QMM0_PARTN|nr:hypothetical protein KIN20_015979 [Parelaphostrongylus tenuis]
MINSPSFSHATDLMKASPSTDHSGDSLSPHDNLPSDEEKVFKSPHSVDEKPAIEVDLTHYTVPTVHFDTMGRHIVARHFPSFYKVFPCFLFHCKVSRIFQWSTGGSHVPKRCMECDKVFAFNFQLQRHVAVVHRARREHKCEECGREFASLSGLNSHRQVNHRNHLYMCPYENCDHPGYKSVQAFKSHIRSVHTKARPYVCKTCGKAFHNGNRLRIHNFTHTSEGAFHCKCGIKFRQKCTLNKHQRLCILD